MFDALSDRLERIAGRLRSRSSAASPRSTSSLYRLVAASR